MNIVETNCNNQTYYITINRPKQLNALNKQVIIELNNEIKQAILQKDIKCIVIKGSGKKAFVAGADIKEFSHFNKKEGEKLSREGQENLFDLIANSPKPIIAVINGYALGGGLELAMACHIRIALNTAKMGLPETSLGLIPGYGGTQRLAELVGKGRAIEMIVTAKMISSEQAYEWGLVNHVCEEKTLDSTVSKLITKINNNSPSAIARAIKSINAGFINDVCGYEVEKIEFGECFGTEEFKEGVEAFMEKRKANF
tara:strand:- start:1639 stop:2406 length:768 start_codon:yes stop_codon:yes gene_type:complete